MNLSRQELYVINKGAVVDFSVDMQARKLRVDGSRQKIVDSQWRGNVKGIELFPQSHHTKTKGPSHRRSPMSTEHPQSLRSIMHGHL